MRNSDTFGHFSAIMENMAVNEDTFGLKILNDISEALKSLDKAQQAQLGLAALSQINPDQNVDQPAVQV